MKNKQSLILRSKNKILIVLLVVLVTIFIGMQLSKKVYQSEHVFKVRSVDTVKYSRDLASQKLHDEEFNETIQQQVSNISQTGANYVAISTPYDPQFLPYLRKWVLAARDHNLKVWFRGNFSGWEGWFKYGKIDSAEHTKLTREFILNNPDLFEDGDIFTPCPECENGGPGDPRKGDVTAFRQMMVTEYQQSQEDFGKIGKKVITNFASMNYDVASLVMDSATTEKMGGVVAVDHYAKDPKQIALSLKKLANISGGKIVLSEFGAPVPDINGKMSEGEQAAWLDQLLTNLEADTNVIGLNYWTGAGSSTAIWNEQGSPKEAVSILTKFYSKMRKMKSNF